MEIVLQINGVEECIDERLLKKKYWTKLQKTKEMII